MKDESKTKKQLIAEIKALSRETAGLKRSEAKHKQVLAALKESEERYRLATEHSNEGIIVIKGDERVFFNQKYLELTGYGRPEEIAGKPLFVHIHPDDRGKVETFMRRRQKGEPAPSRYEYRIIRRDGTVVWVEISTSIITYKGEKASLGYLRDITERKRAEEEMKNSEQRLSSVIQGSPIPTFLIGKDHRVIYWNRALEELSRIRAEDVIGTREHWRAFYRSARPCMADLIVDDALETVPDWYSGKYSKSRLLDEAYEATDFFPELGDEGRWLRFTAAAIRSSEGDLVGAVETLEDVTERKRAEEELIKIKRLESLGHFADRVAKDFDGLLSAILRNIFLAKVSVTEEDKAMEELLSIAEKAGLQAKELAYRLLTFAKGGYLQRRETLIEPILRETAANVLADSNVQCRFSIADDLWSSEVDDEQIRRVIQNIVRNAREAMPEGGTMDVAAENVTARANGIPPLKEGNYLKVSIRDRGIGISKENLSKIFEPYYTTKTARGRKGTGLGLAVCYSIVKNHGGLMTVESEAGCGTTFHIYLPAFSHAAEKPSSERPGD